jgi:hypothetical protein
MEPWEIKIDDKRKEDSKKVFIIFCEDGAVEPAYFDSFKREDIHISTHGPPKPLHLQCPCTKVHLLVKELKNSLGS